MAETLFPDNDDFFEFLPLVDTRVSVAINEIIRRLKYDLPRKIDAMNTRLNYPNGKGIRKPAADAYYPAPAVLVDKHINSVVVGASVDSVAHSPGIMRNEPTIMIAVIDNRIEHPDQVTDTWDRAGIVKGCLYPYLHGCEDNQGRQCWTLLEPQSATVLPESYNNFSGISLYYRLIQDPTVDNWI